MLHFFLYLSHQLLKHSRPKKSPPIALSSIRLLHPQAHPPFLLAPLKVSRIDHIPCNFEASHIWLILNLMIICELHNSLCFQWGWVLSGSINVGWIKMMNFYHSIMNDTTIMNYYSKYPQYGWHVSPILSFLS